MFIRTLCKASRKPSVCTFKTFPAFTTNYSLLPKLSPFSTAAASPTTTTTTTTTTHLQPTTPSSKTISHNKLNSSSTFPQLSYFISQQKQQKQQKEEQEEQEEPILEVPYLPYRHDQVGDGRKVYIETYGCQMNVSDSELVLSILLQAGFQMTQSLQDADVILANTCAIRENAEQKIWQRLNEFKALKMKRGKMPDQPQMIVGVLGCMAERLKEKLLDSNKLVDLVVGPDAYRALPQLLTDIDKHPGHKAINVLLSLDETYADISPIRHHSNNVTAYVSLQFSTFFIHNEGMQQHVFLLHCAIYSREREKSTCIFNCR